MLTNYESKSYAGEPDAGLQGGLNITDVADPADPKHVHFWPYDKSGLHRFTYDGRYAYISPELEGYVGNIVMILDIKDPSRPVEVGRWHMPGQWIAGGEEPTWEADAHRCYHPIRMGNRLYTSYWHGGFVILNINDMSIPKFVSDLDGPALRVPDPHLPADPVRYRGRKWMVVADKDAGALWTQHPGAMLWMVNIIDETNPIPVATDQLDPENLSPRSGCHQPAEDVKGTEIPVA